MCIFLHRYNGMYMMLIIILYYIISYYIILFSILCYSLCIYIYTHIQHMMWLVLKRGINRINSRYMQSESGGAGSQTNSDAVNDRDIKWTMFDTNIYHNYIKYIYVYDLYVHTHIYIYYTYIYILYLYIHELYPLINYIHIWPFVKIVV